MENNIEHINNGDVIYEDGYKTIGIAIEKINGPRHKWLIYTCDGLVEKAEEYMHLSYEDCKFWHDLENDSK